MKTGDIQLLFQYNDWANKRNPARPANLESVMGLSFGRFFSSGGVLKHMWRFIL